MVGYTRQSSFSNGDTTDAVEVNDEFDQLVNAFTVSNGHNHNGDPANGGLIPLISNSDQSIKLEIANSQLEATGTLQVEDIRVNGQLLGSATGVFPEYDPAITYGENDFVWSGDFLYISLEDDNTGNTPLTSPTQWRIFWDRIKSYVEITNTSATEASLDFQDGNVHVRTPTASTTFTLENIPTNGSTKMELFLTNNGQTIIWPNVTWETTGVEPQLGTIDRVIFSKYEGNTTIYALHIPVVA